jgi:hypothetical protein
MARYVKPWLRAFPGERTLTLGDSVWTAATSCAILLWATAVATRCVAQPKSDNLDVSPHTAVLYKVELA